MGLPAKKLSSPSFEQKDMGSADTFRFNVTTYVVEENYERAIKELKDFMNRESDFPQFKVRSERYLLHAIDLVYAIKAKRSFPGLKNLPMAKQEEINERYTQHFNELQQVLKKVEKIRRDLKIADIRSTVWVIQALMISAFGIALLSFMIDLSDGLAGTTVVVLDDVYLKMTDWLFSIF